MVADNRFLGNLTLRTLPVGYRGVATVEVTLEVDVHGVLLVSAEDKGTGVREALAIAEEALSHEDIERMVREAEEHEKVWATGRLWGWIRFHWCLLAVPLLLSTAQLV